MGSAARAQQYKPYVDPEWAAAGIAEMARSTICSNFFFTASDTL